MIMKDVLEDTNRSRRGPLNIINVPTL